jgi:hypothetical protein
MMMMMMMIHLTIYINNLRNKVPTHTANLQH